MSEEIFIPGEETPEEKLHFQAMLASWSPSVLLRNMFRTLTVAANNLCSFSHESMKLMADKLDAECLAAAMKKCGCDACKLKADYVAEAGPLLLEVAQKLAELHVRFAPRAKAAADKAAKSRDAKEKLQTEMRKLGEKLGRS